jgi:RHS repeat-associated protein
MVGMVDPNHGTTQFGYSSSFNRLTSLTDARGNATQYSYDAKRNLTNITYVDGTYEQFRYNSSGNVTNWINRRGQNVYFTYNAAGQVTKKDYDTTPYVDYTYAYDSLGRLTNGVYATATNAFFTNFFTYATSTDWLIRIDCPGGKWLTFEYDSAGRRTKRTDQDGNVANFAYDAQGRLQRMADGAGNLIVHYDFDTAGRISRKMLGNGVYTTYDYDLSGKMTNLVNWKSDSTVLSSFSYAYDTSGRRTAVTTLASTTRYAYDANGQLIHVTNPDASEVEYRYDTAGNRIQVVDNGVVTPYTVNAMNQYSNVGSATYQFDGDGNTVAKVESGVTNIYTYNAENQLVRLKSGTNTWAYIYDGLGCRIKTVFNGVEANYVIDPVGLGNIVGEYDAMGQLISRYDCGYGLIARFDATNASCFYTFDALGSTSELTDGSGGLRQRQSYDPFGKAVAGSGNNGNQFQYLGEYGVVASGNGLLLMRARNYDPIIGRFTAPDPLHHADSLNLYVYARNCPTLFVDPTGCSVNAPVVVDGVIRLAGNGVTAVFGAGAMGVGVIMAVGGTGSVVGIPIAVLGIPVATGGAFLLDQGLIGMTAAGGDILTGLGFIQPAYRPGGMFAAEANKIDPNGTIPGLREKMWLYDFGSTLAVKTLLSLLSGGMLTAGHLLAEEGEEVISPLLLDLIQGTAFIDSITRFSITVFSQDPNDKLTAGYRSQGFISSDSGLPYVIRFENKSTATAPAQMIVVADQLSPNLDLDTFELNEIALGQNVIVLPRGLSYYQTSLNLGACLTDIEVGLDPETRTLTATMMAIDPLTGWLPEDVMTGILPPNDSTGRGEGYIAFTVSPKAGLTNATVILNTATITFDWNDPINTPTVTNTLDILPPSSQVAALPAQMTNRTFTVNWSGQDNPGGAGIASYDLFVSDNGGDYRLVVGSTTNTSTSFTGAGGHTYAFVSVARDNAGNLEPVPTTPDAQTYVIGNSPPVLAAIADRTANVGTLLIFTNTATDLDLPAQKLTFSLDPGAPAGATVNPTNGIFRWTPDISQASTTNTITVRVTDNGTPSLGATRTFTVTVMPYVQVTLGVSQVIMLAGETTNIPVRVIASIPLTDLGFSLNFLPGRLTNFAIVNSASNLQWANILEDTPAQAAVYMKTLTNQSIQGTQQVFQVSFTAVSNQPSAFIPVTLDTVTATREDGASFTSGVGIGGRLVVIGQQPLLEALLATNGQRFLALYGRPGASYALESATNSLAAAQWAYLLHVPITNFVWQTPELDATPAQIFYRAYEF